MRDGGGPATRTELRTPGMLEIPNPENIANFEAEAALLGGLMIANAEIPGVAEIISPDDFSNELHGRIFKAIARLYEKGRAATPVTLRPIFQHDPDMAPLGGAAYLAQLTGSAAAIIGLRDFAAQVAELSARRKVAIAMYEALYDMTSPDEDSDEGEIEELVTRVQDTASIALSRSVSAKPMSSAAAIDLVEERARRLNETGADPGLKCKTIPDIDKVLGMLQPGFYLIGGRPGMAKTTVACCAAWGYAAGGSPQEYFHLEMTEDQMAMRHTSDLSFALGAPIQHERILENRLDAGDLRAMPRVKELASTLPINFTACSGWDIGRLEANIERRVRYWRNMGKPMGAVWIDYLQLVQAKDDKGRPITEDTQRINAVSSACVRISKRLKIPIVALVQLSRAIDDRKEKRPQLNDLKGSGNLEQDADVVAFVFREEVYWLKEKPRDKDELDKAMEAWRVHYACIRDKVEFICEKNRHGKKHTRSLKFFGQYFAVRSSNFSEADDPIMSPQLFDDDREAWA